jgi:hypothetical protein
MDERDDMPLADPERPGAVPNDMPSGMPTEDAPEGDPLGVHEADPDGEGAPARGAEAMPGIPTEGEPPGDA